MCTFGTGLYIHRVIDTTHLGPKDSLHSLYLLLKLQQTVVLQVNPLIISQPEKETLYLTLSSRPFTGILWIRDRHY